MSTETSHPPAKGAHGARGARGEGYERRDANIPGLLQFAFWMAVVIALTLLGMKWTFSYFKKVQSLGPSASPLVDVNSRLLPPSPRLQAKPHLELQDYCAAQQRQVNGYGWVNEEAGVVRIPVDLAMSLVLERGLPVRSSAEAPAHVSSVPPASWETPRTQGMEGPCGYLAHEPDSGSGPGEGTPKE